MSRRDQRRLNGRMSFKARKEHRRMPVPSHKVSFLEDQMLRANTHMKMSYHQGSHGANSGFTTRGMNSDGENHTFDSMNESKQG